MLEGQIANIYLKLWADGSFTEDPRCWPRYVLFDRAQQQGTGYYSSHDSGERWPSIGIFRFPAVPVDNFEPDLAGASLDELISLAHERGHERSDHAGTYKENTMGEERRAWEHARDILVALGFQEWTAFEDMKARALRSYSDAGTPED